LAVSRCSRSSSVTWPEPRTDEPGREACLGRGRGGDHAGGPRPVTGLRRSRFSGVGRFCVSAATNRSTWRVWPAVRAGLLGRSRPEEGRRGAGLPARRGFLRGMRPETLTRSSRALGCHGRPDRAGSRRSPRSADLAGRDTAGGIWRPRSRRIGPSRVPVSRCISRRKGGTAPSNYRTGTRVSSSCGIPGKRGHGPGAHRVRATVPARDVAIMARGEGGEGSRGRRPRRHDGRDQAQPGPARTLALRDRPVPGHRGLNRVRDSLAGGLGRRRGAPGSLRVRRRHPQYAGPRNDRPQPRGPGSGRRPAGCRGRVPASCMVARVWHCDRTPATPSGTRVRCRGSHAGARIAGCSAVHVHPAARAHRAARVAMAHDQNELAGFILVGEVHRGRSPQLRRAAPSPVTSACV